MIQAILDVFVILITSVILAISPQSVPNQLQVSQSYELKTFLLEEKIQPPVKQPVAKNKPIETVPIQILPPSTAVPELEQIPTLATNQITDFASINAKTRTSIVNILCLSKNNSIIRSTTGTGIFIDDRGVILTNAHLGQYFLLKDYPAPNFVECTIRTGSPAISHFKAKLLYLPPSWIKIENSTLTTVEPTGSGEDDYALLLVTNTTNPKEAPPSTFTFLPTEVTYDYKAGDRVLAAAYPAGFLGGSTIVKELYSASAETTINDVFSFDGEKIEFLSLTGNIVAQKGSSGGAVVNDKGELTALISTVSDGVVTEDRLLGSITLAHISNSLQKNSGENLSAFLQGDLNKKSELFDSNVAPSLLEQLKGQINI